MKELKVPTLVINGSNDQHEVDSVQYMNGKNHEIQVGLIPNAGHTANIDRPDVYNLIVKEFIENHK